MNKKDEPIWCQMYREQVIKPKNKARFTEKYGRTKESQSGFYTTKEWIAIRNRRRSENPLCQECEKKNGLVPMHTVDHIISVDSRPDLALDYDNTQSLCNYHHIQKTNADKKKSNELKRLQSGIKIMKEIEIGGG